MRRITERRSRHASTSCVERWLGDQSHGRGCIRVSSGSVRSVRVSAGRRTPCKVAAIPFSRSSRLYGSFAVRSRTRCERFRNSRPKDVLMLGPQVGLNRGPEFPGPVAAAGLVGDEDLGPPAIPVLAADRRQVVEHGQALQRPEVIQVCHRHWLHICPVGSPTNRLTAAKPRNTWVSGATAGVSFSVRSPSRRASPSSPTVVMPGSSVGRGVAPAADSHRTRCRPLLSVLEALRGQPKRRPQRHPCRRATHRARMANWVFELSVCPVNNRTSVCLVLGLRPASSLAGSWKTVRILRAGDGGRALLPSVPPPTGAAGRTGPPRCSG